jgi:putative membrane protein
MNGFKLFLAEWAKIKSNKGLLFSLIAVLLIPIVYAAIQLSPTWGPYDNLSNLPVAVVNMDKGGISGDEPINVGEDLVNDLKKSNTLGWDFVDSKTADKGLKENRYYMVIEIPEDFSERVTTVLEADPKQLELRYIQNEGLNFMAAQVTKSATERIREQLGNKITENYVKNIFSNLGDIAGGFKSAADGSGKIYDGSTELKNGTDQILQSLTEKSTDITKLAAGAKELESGTGQLLQSLTSKQADISKLAAGSKDLKDGTGQLLQSLQAKAEDISKLATGAKALETGANSLQDGTGKVLAGLQQSQVGSNQITLGLGQLEPGSKQVAAGVTEVQAGATQLSAGSQQLTAGLEAFLKQNPQLQTNKEFLTLLGTSKAVSEGLAGLATKTGPLKDGANLVASGLEKLAPGSKALNAGLVELVKGQQSVDAGAKQLAGGTKEVAAGTAIVDSGWKTMTAGVTKLNAGSNQIYNGNQAVESGWRELSAGASKLNSGMSQVSDGNESVMNGWVALTDGVTKVNDGLGQLNDGSKELATGLKDGSEKTAGINSANEKNIAMFASPVELAGSKVNEYERYRDSTAPFILSLALFVGTIIMSFFVDFKKPIGAPISASAWFISKFMSLSVLAIAQGLLVTVFTLVFLKLNVESGFLFVIFGILVSLSFMMIVWFLVALAGNVGRFVAFALLVLQLSTTGANLPIEMLPEYLRALSPYLPLTYSIEGFKSIISLGDFNMAYGNAGILVGYLALALLLALTTFFVHFKSKPSQFDLPA